MGVMNNQAIADIQQFLLYGQHTIKNKMLDIIQQYNHQIATQNVVFHSDIVKQFEDIAKDIIRGEIAMTLGSDPETINIVLDQINVKEYILS